MGTCKRFIVSREGLRGRGGGRTAGCFCHFLWESPHWENNEQEAHATTSSGLPSWSQAGIFSSQSQNTGGKSSPYRLQPRISPWLLLLVPLLLQDAIQSRNLIHVLFSLAPPWGQEATEVAERCTCLSRGPTVSCTRSASCSPGQGLQGGSHPESSQVGFLMRNFHSSASAGTGWEHIPHSLSCPY